MKKKPEISFRVFEGSGPLSIYWYDGPYGDATEAKEGDGVFWLGPTGELLAAEFDNVASDGDEQILIAPNKIKIQVTTKNGKAKVSVISRPDAA